VGGSRRPGMEVPARPRHRARAQHCAQRFGVVCAHGACVKFRRGRCRHHRRSRLHLLQGLHLPADQGARARPAGLPCRTPQKPRTRTRPRESVHRAINNFALLIWAPSFKFLIVVIKRIFLRSEQGIHRAINNFTLLVCAGHAAPQRPEHADLPHPHRPAVRWELHGPVLRQLQGPPRAKSHSSRSVAAQGSAVRSHPASARPHGR
jgi:hypothetical protein